MLSRKADLSNFGATAPLGDLFELPTPGLHLTTDRDRLREGRQDGRVRVLTGRDIRRDGTIAPADDQSWFAQVPTDRHLKVGDLVARRVLDADESGGLVISNVGPEDVPAVASNMVIVLRPKEALDPPRRLLASLFLRSPLARTLAIGAGQTGMHINRAALQDIPIPQPDPALAAAMQDLTSAAEKLESWRSEAENLVQSIFSDKNAAAARSRIVRSGRMLRLRTESAALIDDFGYTVRTRFPHPIAYRWRSVEAAMTSGQNAQAYEAVLEAAEVLLAYAALLALAMARHAGIDVKKGPS